MMAGVCVSPGTMIFLGDILHVLEHVGAHGRERRLAFRLVRAALSALKRFQRKFRIDDDGRLGAGQADHAIGPVAVRKRRLEFVEPGGSASATIASICAWPNSAARLLVGENLLQADDLRPTAPRCSSAPRR